MRLQVFSIKEVRERDGSRRSVWVRAGQGFRNEDGTIELQLDVLPLDGKLVIREAPEPQSKPGAT